ncbi:hypothetical protein ID866_3923 [Astraeus odoratus]|nr:hypothetical protein ID866_3923 [Astraeus odoratus]
MPTAGTGALRDKIAKFEEKGGIPVPRGSFAMGVPSPTESGAAKRRGELYGNRIQGLGRPSGPPVSRSGSPLPLNGEPPAARKRCISTGGALSGGPAAFSADDAAPPLPMTPTPQTRRNSLAVDFGPGRRVVSEGLADATTEDAGSPPASPSPCLSQLDVSDDHVPEPSLEEEPLCVPAEAHESHSAIEESTPVELVEEEEELDVEQEERPSSVAEPQPSVTPSLVVDDIVTEENDPPMQELVPQPTVPESSDPVSVPLPPSPDEVTPVDTSPVESRVEMEEMENVASSSVDSEMPVAPVVETVTEESDTAPASATVSNSTEQTTTRPPSPVSKRLAPSVPENRTTFKAIVHRKVTEMPAATAPASSLAAPPTPQVLRARRVAATTAVDPSPGPGELTILLEEAALLELRLTGGDNLENPDALSLKTPTSTTFQSDPRSESATTLTEQKPVPPPDSDADVPSRLSISIPAIREPALESEIPEIPEEDETSDGKSLASTTFSQRSPSHKKYLSGLRRLTGRRSSTNMPGAYPRDSISLSSEDSAPVATPPDSGNVRNGGFGIAWPSVSPKRQASSVGRASSFTDKLFNRNRTRSNVSTADTGIVEHALPHWIHKSLVVCSSDRSSVYETPQLSLNIPSPDASPPRHRTGQDAGARPTSWIPRDSCSELSPTSNSSFFDKDIFDAFPSVPQTLPPGPYSLDAGDGGVGRASTLHVKGRRHPNQRLSMM